MTYAIDFEYFAAEGERPRPHCLCWVIVETGEEGRLWIDDTTTAPTFGRDGLIVAHYALAELGCYEALGWATPPRVIDTLAEARVVRGQARPGGGWGLLGVAAAYGIQTMSGEHKGEMREVAMQPEVPVDRRGDLLEYCLDDCRALAELWRRLGPSVDLPRAELRGRYLKALGRVEGRGIPADVELIGRLASSWPAIREKVRESALEVYPGTFSDSGSFSATGWLRWCDQNAVPWPQYPTGAPQLDDDTFKRVASRFPEVEFMRNTRRTLSQSRAVGFPLGADGRLRCMLSPFGSDTGRNQPSNAKYVFGQAAWLRRIIQAPPGRVLGYIDFSSQEFAVAAALSGDEATQADYQSGDPYLALARRSHGVPDDATKATHPKERAAFKITALAVQYGMQSDSLAASLGVGRGRAAELIRAHREAYSSFWKWRDAVIDHLLTGGRYETILGWRRIAKSKDKSTSIGNFPFQAAGGEILRLAIIALEEAGHRVVAPVHDAVLIEMEEDGHEEELGQVRRLMEKAGRVITGGMTIRTDAELVMPGEHFEDPRGTAMWEVIGAEI